MNKVLPDQIHWSPPSQVQRREQEDFAQKLHARSREEPGRPSTDHFTTTRDPVTPTSSPTASAKVPGWSSIGESGAGEWEESAVPAGEMPSTLESDNAGVDGALGPVPNAMFMRDEASTPPIGLLSGMLTWSRVFPQHLVASGYLSMVDMARREANVSAEQNALEGSGADIHELGVNTPTPPPDLISDSPEAESTSALDPPNQPMAGNEGAATSIDPEVAPSSRALDAATLADSVWAERLIRLTRDGHGGSTVWLRDYGLKENKLESVAAELRLRGQQEGVLIGRVVINGHEVWRAATSEGER